MLLYNITVGIDKDAEQDWLQWMRLTHIPEVMATGMFADSKMYRVLHDSEDGTISYSIQYFANSIDNIQRYLEEFSPNIVDEHHVRFKNKHVAFRTLLEEV